MHSGEIIRGNNGELTVVGLTRAQGIDRVYNMTVEADHVYYVGDLPALVHNNCPGPGGGVNPPRTDEPGWIEWQYKMLRKVYDMYMNQGKYDDAAKIWEVMKQIVELQSTPDGVN
jgi:hypothetical protein